MLEKILDDLIIAEGVEYTNHSADRGGPTKFGITLKTLQGLPGRERATSLDVMHMKIEEARKIYTELYAKPFLFLGDTVVFKFLFNAAVQHGVKAAVKMLQRSLDMPESEVDGVLGPKTQSLALNTGLHIRHKLIAARCRYYANILSKDKSQLVFAAGWFNRIAKDLS